VPDVRVPAAELERLTADLLVASGASTETAAGAAALLVRADLAGHGSHGVRLVPLYCDACRTGAIAPTAIPTIDRDDGSTVSLDGNCALGQVAGIVAIDLAIARAREHGVAVVTLRRSGHLGRLADYVERAAGAGMIAILAANDSGANQVVAPHGSDEGRLATNPIAVGIPREAPPHLVLDMATSVVSHGTLELTQLDGSPVPSEWTTPRDVLLPLGGPKGTGLALVVEVLAGILSGAGFSTSDPTHDYQGVWLLALDPERFLPPGRLAADVEALVAHVHSAHPTPGSEVLVPGEPGARAAQARLRDGVQVPAPVWAELLGVAATLGVDVNIHSNGGEEPQ
jgi:LDH2 family malate/lactate/ureidoglycolate dehydrogenase